MPAFSVCTTVFVRPLTGQISIYDSYEYVAASVYVCSTFAGPEPGNPTVPSSQPFKVSYMWRGLNKMHCDMTRSSTASGLPYTSKLSLLNQNVYVC